ncbi:TonB-dependent receptor [Cytophagaceae bacterium DM2B3-1]|uniref:TonB-dependent receptor n=1 Tax=Xanthocytophaga flava TaxID=3048013 RepID=A0ABT7CI48_9BACT|nr:TonB-dependent receptor [Xanthocytophaga flavus]MDJ1493412.1 TonB-dependent receptor [Xanthocytophaga flavus]
MRLKTILFTLFLSISFSYVQGQDVIKGSVAQERSQLSDTVSLSQVTVVGYQNNRSLLETPATIGVLKNTDLQRFSNTSFVSAVNTLPGIRMEERSPGSYRFSVRGSLVRSPFGIRNVKFYWNDIPFTDAGGNTYLNLIDFNAIGGMEIIKGPGGSLYGAGTGGTALLQSPVAAQGTSVQLGSIAGSYGLFGVHTMVQSGSEKMNATALYAHQESDGYRRQTAMRRDMVSLSTRFFSSENRTFSVNTFYSDLSYQTPGGLTKAQMDTDPRQARPAAGVNKGAEEQKAAVFNKTFNLGVSQEYDFNANWTNKTSVYGTITQFENPTLRNYDKRTEQGFGGRTITQYRFGGEAIKGKITFGGEFQYGYTGLQTYGNRNGKVDTLQYNDEIQVNQYTIFAQTELDLPHHFFLTLGGSYNKQNYNLVRFYPENSGPQNRHFDPIFLPRVALLKQITSNMSIFGSISYGYSTPTTDEIRPSTATFNTSLNPEKGINYEIGTRGSVLGDILTFDITAFSFGLHETIVSRRTDAGADFYTNSGKTSQKGIESRIVFQPHILQNAFTLTRVWVSYTRNNFRFKEYVQSSTDLSGKQLTGIAPNIVVTGLDLVSTVGFYLNTTFSYTDKLPVDDANTFFAAGYKLLGGRLGFMKDIKRFNLNVFGGLDNLLDEKYSLGNDLNAVGNRFYNPAPGRNFYGGLTLKYKI